MDSYYDAGGRVVVLGDGAIDYLSITTYDQAQYDRLLGILSIEYSDSMEHHAVMSYEGRKYADYVFAGKGRQQSKNHYILIATAIHSDVLYRHLMTDKDINLDTWKVTRIDIQVTLPEKKRATRLGTIGLNLQNGKYGEVSNRRKVAVKTIIGDTGDTIYIGSPKSEKQRRIYKKILTDIDDNVKDFQRYEIQYRSNTAQSVSNKLRKDSVLNLSTNIQKLVKGDVSLLPEKFTSKLSFHTWNPKMVGEVVNRTRKESKTTNQTKWIRSIRYALLKGCNQEGFNGLFCKQTLMEALVISITENNTEPTESWKLLSPWGEVVSLEGVWYDKE
jgi:hypothetical protein